MGRDRVWRRPTGIVRVAQRGVNRLYFERGLAESGGREWYYTGRGVVCGRRAGRSLMIGTRISALPHNQGWRKGRGFEDVVLDRKGCCSPRSFLQSWMRSRWGHGYRPRAFARLEWYKQEPEDSQIPGSAVVGASAGAGGWDAVGWPMGSAPGKPPPRLCGRHSMTWPAWHPAGVWIGLVKQEPSVRWRSAYTKC